MTEGKKGKIPPQFLANIKKKGEAGKKPVKESNYKCLECTTGMYEQDHMGRHVCNECGSAMMLSEASMAYDKKTATMKPRAKDADQRHGLYDTNGKLLRATNTKEEADNLKKRDQRFKNATVKKIAEGISKYQELDEKWDTKMNTAKKDIGKWDGWTIAELKAKKKKLMDKEERSAAEQKEVKQINFAIRAKQENHWGKIKEESLQEANGKPTSEKEKKLAALAPPKDKITRADVLKGRGVIEEGKCPQCRKKPCVCEAVNEAEDSSTAKLALMAATGKDDKGKPLNSQQKAAAKKAADELAKAKIEEKLTKSMSAGEIISDFVNSDDPKFKGKSKAERTKMALGAYYGMHPEKSKKEESQLAKCNALLEALAQKLQALNTQFAAHKKDFNKQINEGKQIDPLNLGYGLAGDAIRQKITAVKKQISEAEALKSAMMANLKQRKQTISETKREIAQLDQQLGSTPFGVVGIDTTGKRTSKFFESAEQRNIWLEFHKDTLTEHQLINPDLISKAQNYLKKRIKG